MTEFGRIYCITNATNGKQYVGQTRYSVARRWQRHKHLAETGSMCALHCAIRKYGTVVFEVEQIDFAETLEELNEKEACYILQLKTLAPSGYNLTTGGDGFEFSAETIAKMSVVAGTQERRVGWFHTADTCKKISDACKKSCRPMLCHNGHPFDDVTTYMNPTSGRRMCRACYYLHHGKTIPKKYWPYLGL